MICLFLISAPLSTALGISEWSRDISAAGIIAVYTCLNTEVMFKFIFNTQFNVGVSLLLIHSGMLEYEKKNEPFHCFGLAIVKGLFTS